MGMRLVYTVGKTGDIEGLLKDEKLDTSSFGHRQIERITEIAHNNKAQMFYIMWLRGPYAGRPHNTQFNEDMGIPNKKHAKVPSVQYFETYQYAVDHEIKCVNRLRELGHSFA